MAEDLQTLDKKIQYWREKLHTLLSYNSLVDDNVVLCSQYLDKLLVEYEKHKH